MGGSSGLSASCMFRPYRQRVQQLSPDPFGRRVGNDTPQCRKISGRFSCLTRASAKHDFHACRRYPTGSDLSQGEFRGVAHGLATHPNSGRSHNAKSLRQTRRASCNFSRPRNARARRNNKQASRRPRRAGAPHKARRQADYRRRSVASRRLGLNARLGFGRDNRHAWTGLATAITARASEPP